MQVKQIFVASQDAVNTMTLPEYARAIIGGMNPDEVTVFTSMEEAEAHLQRTRLLKRAMAALCCLSTDVVAQITESLEKDGGYLPLFIRVGREQSVLETMQKCGI